MAQVKRAATRVKDMFPKNVRLSGTSWVTPGTFAQNMRALAKEARDMQFVLFDAGGASNIPSAEEIKELSALKKELGMSCIVHFPHDVCLSPKQHERVRCEDSCIKTMELFAPLEPFAWVLHLDGERLGEYPSADMPRWLEKSDVSLRRIARYEPRGEPRNICVETLDYKYSLVYPIVAKNGASVCLDVGHLVKYGRDVREHLNLYMSASRVVHIHGVKPDGTDHTDMSFFDAALFRETVSYMSRDEAERVFTLEVFEDDYEKSLSAIRKFMGG